VDGTGLWIPYKAFDIKAGKKLQHTFPEGYSAYWVRAISEKNATCTVQFKYE